jgi:hypothetical protein
MSNVAMPGRVSASSIVLCGIGKTFGVIPADGNPGLPRTPGKAKNAKGGVERDALPDWDGFPRPG